MKGFFVGSFRESRFPVSKVLSSRVLEAALIWSRCKNHEENFQYQGQQLGHFDLGSLGTIEEKTGWYDVSRRWVEKVELYELLHNWSKSWKIVRNFLWCRLSKQIWFWRRFWGCGLCVLISGNIIRKVMKEVVHIVNSKWSYFIIVVKEHVICLNDAGTNEYSCIWFCWYTVLADMVILRNLSCWKLSSEKVRKYPVGSLAVGTEDEVIEHKWYHCLKVKRRAWKTEWFQKTFVMNSVERLHRWD